MIERLEVKSTTGFKLPRTRVTADNAACTSAACTHGKIIILASAVETKPRQQGAGLFSSFHYRFQRADAWNYVVDSNLNNTKDNPIHLY